MGEETFLLWNVVIFLYIDTLYEILCPYTFYSRQDTINIYSFSRTSVLVQTCTHTGIFNRLVLVTHTRTHKEEYSTDYIRLYVIFPFFMYFLIHKFNFVCTAFWMFFCSRIFHRLLHLPFKIKTNILWRNYQPKK